MTKVPVRVGEWLADPVSSQLSKGEEVISVETRSMRLLMVLAERTGDVLSLVELLGRVWSGVVVTPDIHAQGPWR